MWGHHDLAWPQLRSSSSSTLTHLDVPWVCHVWLLLFFLFFFSLLIFLFGGGVPPQVLDKLCQTLGADVVQMLFNMSRSVTRCPRQRLALEGLTLLVDQGIALLIFDIPPTASTFLTAPSSPSLSSHAALLPRVQCVSCAANTHCWHAPVLAGTQILRSARMAHFLLICC